MRYLKKFKTEDEMAKFFNSSKYKKGLPFVAKLGEVNDVTFFEKDSLKLKYKITEDMSEAIEEYKTVLAAIGYDNNKMVLTNNGNIYDSFIVNGVEQALPLSEIKHTNFGPIYEENKSIPKNGKTIYCTNGLNSDVNATFETPFDLENGYMGLFFYSKTLNQIVDGKVAPIKEAPSEELEAMMNVTSDSVQLKKDFIDMIYSRFDAEDIESYGMEIGFSFINEIPNWDGTINIETINYVSNNAITCSYTYTYSDLNTEEVSFNDKNIIKDFSITFERPLVETDVFATPLSDEPMPALLVFSLMMDTEDNQHFTPTPMFSTYMMLINVSFFNIHDTEDNYVKYQISYREGGVPQVIYSNLEVGECNIEATILPELYVYNYRPTFIEETNVIYNGYMVTNILPIGRIANGSGGYSGEFNLGLFINEIVLPNGFVQMPEYLSNSPYLEKIIIPDGVTSISDDTFSGCQSLTSIVIPDSVTSIGISAFSNTPFYNNLPNGDVYLGGCYYKYKGTMPSNTSIIIKDGTKSICDNAFRDCNSLTSIVIPSSVTSIGSDAFSGCLFQRDKFINNSNLTSSNNWGARLYDVIQEDGLCISGTTVTACRTNATSVVIPDSVTSIGNYAFENCKNLTSITIPDSVTSIGNYAFRYCDGLTSVIIGNGVTSIGYSAFSRCFNLSSLIIGNNVQIIGSNAFDNCYGLTSVVIPNSVRSLGNSVFEKCNSLNEITYLSTKAPSLGIYVFNGLPSNGVLKVPNGSYYDTWLSNLPSGWTIQFI